MAASSILDVYLVSTRMRGHVRDGHLRPSKSGQEKGGGGGVDSPHYLFGMFLIISVVRVSSPLTIFSRSRWYCLLLSSWPALFSTRRLRPRSAKPSKPPCRRPVYEPVPMKMGLSLCVGIILKPGAALPTALPGREALGPPADRGPMLIIKPPSFRPRPTPPKATEFMKDASGDSEE